MPEYTMSIEQDAVGRWTAARDALKDALYARDGVEPHMCRNRTEVPTGSTPTASRRWSTVSYKHWPQARLNTECVRCVPLGMLHNDQGDSMADSPAERTNGG